VLRAGIGEKTVAARWLETESLVAVEVGGLRADARIGDRLRLPVVVTNRSKRVVNGVSLAVEVPHAFSVEEGRRTIGRLQPEESRRFEVVATVVAPIEAGTIQVDVASEDGGWARQRVSVRGADPRAPHIRAAVDSKRSR
jgi:uncharacterized membrane protein